MLDQVAKFVYDDVINELPRNHDQFEVEIHFAFDAATAPLGAHLADGYFGMFDAVALEAGEPDFHPFTKDFVGSLTIPSSE